MDTAQSRANEIRIEHPQLWEQYVNDASTHAWLKMWFTEQCTLEEALIGAVLDLGKEKKKLFDEIIEFNMRKLPNPIQVKAEMEEREYRSGL